MARRGRSQARRNSGGNGGLPGWAWMVLGIVLTIGVILAAPKLMKSDGEDGFFRPRANPDAQPVAADDGDDAGLVAGDGDAAAADDPATTAPDYDFYDLLPGEEVAMSDAQLAAAAREEQARAAQSRPPQPLPESTVTPVAADDAPDTATATATASTGDDTPYILQAGAFRGSGDAEAVKARIALLGLNARVEAAQINGATVYRVRMGPYGTASELAAAKAKLANGGLPALAIKAK